MARTWGVLLLLAAAAAAEDDPYASMLASEGIRPSRAGLGEFLTLYLPNEGTPNLIGDLIARLAGPSPAGREAAARQLGLLPFLARGAVAKASNSADPEVRRLCRRILREQTTGRHEDLLNAVFQTIRHRRVKGLAAILLRALPYCRKGYLVDPARRALVATARPSDAALLRSALATSDPQMRIAAAQALRAVAGSEAAPDLRGLLPAREEAVRLFAAEALARLHDASCLPALAELLDSGDAQVRFRSCAILRAVTGRQFGFVAHAPAGERQAPAQRWLDLVRSGNDAIRIWRPLELPPVLLGRTLVCSIHSRCLEEYDNTARRLYRSKPMQLPWGCHGLPNGHRLVAVYDARSVVEFDRSGREIWRTEGLPGKPMSVRRLADRSTLIACGDSGKIIEVTRSGRTIWSIALPGRPVDARRLEEGRTLIALYRGRRVVEVDRRGRILWEIGGAGTPCTAQRLADGNTLVAGLERPDGVAEYELDGRLVWRLANLGTVYEAQRLRNGNTLVASSNGVREYDRSGRIVWKRDIGACRAMRY